MSYYYLKEVDFMLNKIHKFALCMEKECQIGIALLAAECIVWGIVDVIIRLINKKVN